jgi:hypothetical protein
MNSISTNTLRQKNKEQLIKMVQSKEFQRRKAWAMYFDIQTTTHANTIIRYEKLCEVPEHIKLELIEMINELKKEIECPVCLSIIPTDNLAISRCGHKYCKGCIDTMKERNLNCAICRETL